MQATTKDKKKNGKSIFGKCSTSQLTATSKRHMENKKL